MKRKPPTAAEVTGIFNKFAGREVPMKEETKTLHLDTLGDYTFNEVKPANPDDPTLKEMHDEARKHGLNLRVWWDGVAGTADFQNARVNTHIEKGADGKYRIAPRFDIG